MECVRGAQKAGVQYTEVVSKNRRGHDLGPPHTHKVMAFVEMIHQETIDGDDKRALGEVVALMNDEAKGKENVNEMVPFCEIKQWNGGGKGIGKGK